MLTMQHISWVLQLSENMNSLQQQVSAKLELIVYKDLTQEQVNKNHIPYEIIYGMTACQDRCYTLKSANSFSVHENLFIDKELFDQRVVDLCITYFPFNLHIDTRMLPREEAKDQLFGLDNDLCKKILNKIEFLETDYDNDHSKRFL